VSREATQARILRGAAAVLAVAVGAWAGVRGYQLLSVKLNRGTWHADALRSDGASSSPRPSRADAGTTGALGDGDALAELDPLHVPVRIPERLPDFSLPDRDGRRTSIRTWDGRSLVINFWATWCEPCRREIPLLKSLSTQWTRRGFTMIGIAVDERPRVLAYAAEMSIGYPLLIGEQDALDAADKLGFESPAFPFTVFTDRRGEVVALFLGELHAEQAALILSEVVSLNEEREALPEARRAIAAGLHAIAARGG
jgi:thiol-disulfide isomerase/thioredoxin